MCYKDITDVEFVIISSSLITYLYFYNNVHEHFGPESNNEKIDEPAFQKFYKLPTVMYDAIIPKLDYVISALKGNEEKKEPEGLYDVTENDFSQGEINAEKLEKLIITYRGMDEILNWLAIMSPKTYKNLIS